MHTKKDRSFL